MTAWKPIETRSQHVRDGFPFLARWNSGMLDGWPQWEYCVAYYGQFGNCFFWTPIGYHAGAEKWVEEGKGVNGSGFAIGEPEVFPTEWCELPE